MFLASCPVTARRVGWRGGAAPRSHPFSFLTCSRTLFSSLWLKLSPCQACQPRDGEWGGGEHAQCFEALPGSCTPDWSSHEPELGQTAHQLQRRLGNVVSSKVVLCPPPIVACPGRNNCCSSARKVKQRFTGHLLCARLYHGHFPASPFEFALYLPTPRQLGQGSVPATSQGM